MSSFNFPIINPLLHSELRLKIMVALNHLQTADFMYLYHITGSTRGNLSIQLSTLKEAGYVELERCGIGRVSRTVCKITETGKQALEDYKQELNNLFTMEIPTKEEFDQELTTEAV